jgi:hypothetical protein
MIDWKRTWLAVLVFVTAATFVERSARADVIFRDACDDLNAWSLQPSDGVGATLEQTTEPGGRPALRLNYDFRSGSGFVVIRRKVGIALPAEYRLSFNLRGNGPTNNFEIKLLDRSGENVWWVNNRDFAFPAEWEPNRFKRRHFSFAWGPSGGKPHAELGAIEFAIAASSGGKGTVDLSDLVLESIPVVSERPRNPKIVSYDGSIDLGNEASVISKPTTVNWRTGWNMDDGTLTLSLGGVREFGGVIAEFDRGSLPGAMEVLVSNDGEQFSRLGGHRVPPTGRFYLPLRDAEAAFVRIKLRGVGQNGALMRTLEIAPLAFGESHNQTFARIASDRPRGEFPRYFSPEQSYWTVVGVADDSKEGLLSSDGVLEVDKERFTLEPFLLRDQCDGSAPELLSWSNATMTQSLPKGYLPLPIVTRQHGPLSLQIQAFAFGPTGKSVLAATYTLHNSGPDRQRGRFVLSMRPFQVNPPWQDLKTSGGVARIDEIRWESNAAIVTRLSPPDTKLVHFVGDNVRGNGGGFEGGESLDRIAGMRFEELATDTVQDTTGLANGAFVVEFDLGSGEKRDWAVVVPLHDAAELPVWTKAPALEAIASLARERDLVSSWWVDQLNLVRLELPPSGSALADTFRTSQAHILINRDGPAIQPGSRTYERSWIRDGCLTSSALLATGHTERVREFIDWYAPYQYASGKVPCVVDKRGPDPVPEHDSHGQLIYLLRKYYVFTGDKATLERNYPYVVKAVEYIDSIRKERMTPEYANATGLRRAEYGLVPESISHEGYSAKPMHSYWDDFFVEKGLQDAADIARILGKSEDAAQFQTLATDFRATFIDSIKRATSHHKIDYIPGCVELGDFDATSTTIALWPCGAGAWLDRSQLERTFEKFYEFGMGRIDGTKKYNEYTPYEWRIVGAMIRLGWPEKAWKLADFYMGDRRPAAWNQWGEIVWRDPQAANFIGDMPHTWVASDFLNSVRSMFVYEDAAAKSLVIGAGIRPEWLEGEGVSIGSWPTEYGVLSYTARRTGDTITVTYDFGGTMPMGGIEMSPNLAPNLVGATLNGNPASSDKAVFRVRDPRGVIVLKSSR